MNTENETVILLGGEGLFDLAAIHRAADALAPFEPMSLEPDAATLELDARRAEVIRRQAAEWSEIRELALKAARRRDAIAARHAAYALQVAHRGELATMQPAPAGKVDVV
jgi:hypothetical protein